MPQCIVGIASFSDDIKMRDRFQSRTQAVAHQRVVINQQNMYHGQSHFKKLAIRKDRNQLSSFGR
ncbi:hypothetical protein IMCC9480_2563 [Oxalobacteraceae bacterium IMCC9480]|nr:hypothetical protein IMCC9480_2563 [Oxalobacteraceae bacterium IMCC9480]